jgi:hypothetical protein
MAQAIGFPIGATAFLSIDKRGAIQLMRMGLTPPRRLRVAKTTRPPCVRWT